MNKITLREFKMEDILEINLNTRYDKTWEESYYAFKNFMSTYGRAPTVKENKKLSKWAVNQRYIFNKHEMPQKHISLMNCIPGWEWKKYETKSWNDNYKDLCQFVKKHNRLPTRKEKHAAWITTQKSRYNNKTLSQYRINKLNQISIWKWSMRDYRWQCNYEKLLEFIKKYKYLPINLKAHKDRRLNRWCNKQRYSYKMGRLSEYRTDALNLIPIWTWKI